MLELHPIAEDVPVEIDAGYWIIKTNDSHDRAERLREACLHALDRGAEHLAVDCTAARTLSADVVDVLISTNDVLHAHGGTLVLWARGREGSEPFVLGVGDGGVEAMAARLDELEQGGRR